MTNKLRDLIRRWENSKGNPVQQFITLDKLLNYIVDNNPKLKSSYDKKTEPAYHSVGISNETKDSKIEFEVQEGKVSLEGSLNYCRKTQRIAARRVLEVDQTEDFHSSYSLSIPKLGISYETQNMTRGKDILADLLGNFHRGLIH